MGYSRLIGADEEGTLNQLRSIRAELIDPKITEHHGRLVKTTGDGLLVEFGSVIDGLRCATEWQRGMAERNAGTPEGRIEFRIGINVGDVVVQDGDIFGDGVNVNARLEGLAESGGICVSARVQEDAVGRLISRSMIWANKLSKILTDPFEFIGFAAPVPLRLRPRPKPR
ncbi:MAG: adenylate/guanylate cyclase domain-containing protein [Xanthobacteraceae bacterium]